MHTFYCPEDNTEDTVVLLWMEGAQRILDLETRNSELESDNARLEAKLGSKRGR